MSLCREEAGPYPNEEGTGGGEGEEQRGVITAKIELYSLAREGSQSSASQGSSGERHPGWLVANVSCFCRFIIFRKPHPQFLPALERI